MDTLMPPDPLRDYWSLIVGTTGGLQIVAAVCFVAFAVLIAIRTRLPGRYLILTGTLMRVGAGLSLWLMDPLAVQGISVPIAIGCTAALGMAIAGIGCVRLVIALIRNPTVSKAPV
jgi:hypothetical protein